MRTKDIPIDLANLADGQVLQQFSDNFRLVVRDILDPTTKPGPREIGLTIKITPDLKRPSLVTIQCVPKVKLGGDKPVETYASIGIGAEGPEGFEFQAQRELDFGANVKIMKKATEKEE